MSENRGLRSIKNLNDIVMKWLAGDGPERQKLHTNGLDRSVVIAHMKVPTLLLDYIAFLLTGLGTIENSKPMSGVSVCENCVHMQQLASMTLAGKKPEVSKEKAALLNLTLNPPEEEKKLPL